MMGRTGVVLALALMHRLKVVAPTVGAALLVWGLLLAYASSPAQAATITVNSLADDADGTDGECTLREAITSANTDTSSGTATGECTAGSGDDVIEVGVMGTVNLTRVLPPLSSTIEIEGPGSAQFTVRRNTGGDYRIFRVGSGAEVSLSGMTMTNGKTDDAGGIMNRGTLTVTDSTVSDNSAQFTGGGIFNDQGTLTVTGSTISDNSSLHGAGGGGIFNHLGTLTITGSTISDNSSVSLAGGGVYNNGDVGSERRTTITTSTISDNSASFAGGGVYNSRGPLTVSSSTISGNTAADQGGGVYNLFGLTVIEFSTITNNSAPSGRGSGVESSDRVTRTKVLSSIISANTNTDVDFVGSDKNTFVSKGYNLIGDGNATGAFNQTGDQTGVSDPKLDPLGSYGGPTQTHRLQSYSPAVDAGPPTDGDPIACPPPATDQRGVKRPQGESCDSGAFELVQQPPKPTTKEECKKGGYKEFGFKNQGQCIKAVKNQTP
jgi:CSLREA domain-containing protein